MILISESSELDQLVKQLIGVEKIKMRRLTQVIAHFEALTATNSKIYLFIFSDQVVAHGSYFKNFWKSAVERHQLVQNKNKYIILTQ